MEKVCKIQAIGNYEEKDRRDGNGKFKKITVRLKDGSDEFIAEATDDLAGTLNENKIPVGTNVCVLCRLRVSDWKDENGNPRTSTYINIVNLIVL